MNIFVSEYNDSSIASVICGYTRFMNSATIYKYYNGLWPIKTANNLFNVVQAPDI